jgi:hypothetical protein
MSFVTNGSEAMRIDSSGNVGIGTASPVEELTCRGNIGIYGAMSGGAVTETPSLHFYTSEGSAGFNTANSYNIGEISWSGKDGSLNCTGKYASIETKLIDANTQIQGTENEGGQLDFNIYRHDVEARVKHIGLRIDNYANIYQNFINYTDNSNYEALKISAGTSSIKFDTVSVGSFSSNTRPIEFLLNGNAKASIRFYVTNSGAWTTGNFYINGSGALRQASDHLYLSTSTQTDNDIIFKPNDTEAMRIDSSGRLGLGETTPAAYDGEADDFIIKTGGNTGITIRTSSTGKGSIFFADGISGSERYQGNIRYFHSDSTMRFATGAVERFRISSNKTTLFNGALELQETTTPTATADYGKIYCKSDNKLYFQDGAGTEHEIAFV